MLGHDRRCAKVGCFSLKLTLSSSRILRGAILVGLICAVMLPLASSANAQSSRFGARAGSRFTGETSRRPYRRRQPQLEQQYEEVESDFDYRMDSASSEEGDSLAMFGSQDSELMPAGFCTGSADCGCGDCIGSSCCDEGCCDDSCCGGCCEPSCGVAGGGYGPIGLGYYPTWFAGAEFSFVKPRFSQNVAFTSIDDNGAGTRLFTDTEFDYDLEMTPRVWLGAAFAESWSWRCTYWQFDQSPATEIASPAAGGNSFITHPNFGTSSPEFTDVDLTTNVPTDVYTAASDLNAYSIDIEAVKNSRLSGWLLGVAGGMRYVSTEQNYNATLSDGVDVTDQLDYTQELEGFGPTISLSGMRPIFHRVNIVCAARGSLLFGDGVSRFNAVEDLGGTNETTIRVTNREDLLPIGEARLGLEWMSQKSSRSYRWLLTTAMEGQIWGNAGNATSETADLGFFGFNLGAGILR